MKCKNLFLTLGALGLWTMAMGQNPDAQKTAELQPFSPPKPAGDKVGRFQLFQTQANEGDPSPQVLRIDSATGKVWVLNTMKPTSGEAAGTTIQGWVEVGEPNVFLWALLGTKVPGPRQVPPVPKVAEPKTR